MSVYPASALGRPQSFGTCCICAAEPQPVQHQRTGFASVSLSPNVPTRLKPHQLAATWSIVGWRHQGSSYLRCLWTPVQHSHELRDPSSCCASPTSSADSRLVFFVGPRTTVSWSICQATAVSLAASTTWLFFTHFCGLSCQTVPAVGYPAFRAELTSLLIIYF